MALGLLLLLVAYLQVQPEQFQRFDTQSGLSNNIVYDVYQDQYGFIWIGTENGLNRFDGYDFEVYYHITDDSTSLSSNLIRAVIEDNFGDLWVATFNGLNKYNRETGTFKRFTAIPGYQKTRLDIQTLTMDSDGFIWFTLPDLVIKFDPENEKFYKYDHSYYVYQHFHDKDGNVWFQSFDGNSRKLIQLEDEILSAISVNTYLSTFPVHVSRYTDRVWYKGEIDGPVSIKGLTEIPKLPDDLIPSRIMEDRKERLWLGTDEGLFVYNANSRMLKKIELDKNLKILGNSIRQITEDIWGGIWVATLNGLYYSDPSQKAFRFETLMNSSEGLALNIPVMVITQKKDELIIGTLGDGLIIKNLSTQHTRHIDLNDRNTPIKQIWDIYDDPKDSGTYWLATTRGLFRYNYVNNDLEPILLPHRKFATPVIFSISAMSDSSIWVAGDENVYLVETKTGEVLTNISFEHIEGLSTIQQIRVLENQLLIGTEGLGLFIYDLKNNELKSVEQFSETSVWVLFKSDDESIWIGTGIGLFRFDIDSEGFSRIVSDKLSEVIIYSIEQSEDGTLWMGTDKGLTSYHPKTDELSFYDINDGIGNTEFNRRSSFRDGKTLYFGGIEGVTWFEPLKIRENPNLPILHITEMEIYTTEKSTKLKLLDSVNQKIKFSWRENTFEIYFTGLSFTNPEQNQYKYRLKNFDPDWVHSQGRRFARYVKVPPGSYTFEAQASNNDKLWNTEPATLQLEIVPPFWATFWFRTLIVLIIAGGIFFVYRYRVSQLLKMERIRLRIARDLHDEIGSGLSGIALTTDLIEKQSQKNQYELIKSIRKNARELSSSLDTIVWLIDPKKESLSQLIDKLRSTTMNLLRQKSVRFNVNLNEFSKEIHLNPLTRRNLFLICKEAIHNIAKHSGADVISVAVDLTGNGKKLSIIISDNGMGFDKENINNGYGLNSMKMRTAEINGDINIDSRKGSGTCVMLKMSLP